MYDAAKGKATNTQQLEVGKMLDQSGFDEKEIKTAITHIIARCVYPASEHKTLQ
ncbi:MAG: hypothetical protein J7K34_02870 [Flavobacteriaceae bacterium]|nr:hypothetical protein [Flavobacteriaceae bacterium]